MKHFPQPAAQMQAQPTQAVARKTSRWVRWGSLVAVVWVAQAGLVGCSDSHEELQSWMDEQRRDARPKVAPLVAPRKFNPQPYMAMTVADPFSSQKLQVALKQESRQPNSLLATEMNRRREPLEAYPLDSLMMVGSLVRGGKQYALLKAENLLYQVKVGDYLGQNYGRVTQITETEIAIREIVQDAVGEWIERKGALALQERAQEKR